MDLFPARLKRTTRTKMETVTIRNFGGGLNAVDEDLSMGPQFLKILKNFRRTASGSQRLRFGSNLFSDIGHIRSYELREDGGFEKREDDGFELRESVAVVAGSVIVDMVYFSGRIIVVCDTGYIVAVTDTGGAEVIWSPAIAAALPGAPSFWTAGIQAVSFVPVKSTLIIHNGVDKPIIISSAFAVTYLQDLGTGSNVNVPIGKYGCIASNYHCVAGIASNPTQIVLSSKGTSGTFPLDPAPNDAISIDVGAYAPDGAKEILGIAGLRTFLVVFMENVCIQIVLGEYDNATPNPNHVPRFPDTFPSFGLIGSRCIIKKESDMLFAGIQGVAIAKKGVYTDNQMSNDYLSSVIEPLYQRSVNTLTVTQKKLNCFTVYDQLNRCFLLFIPGGEVLVYSADEKLRYKAWSVYSDMDWTCGCTSLLGRVFVAKGTKIFQLGNDTYGERYYADRMHDCDDTWANTVLYTVGQRMLDRETGDTYTCRVTHTSRSTGKFAIDRLANSSFWEVYLGEEISFEFEMPWFIGKDPMKVKKIRFVSIGTKGQAEFTLEAYVDNLFRDEDENLIVFSPALSMTFVGNDAGGFGVTLDDAPFGTGRKSSDPRLFEFPVKFKSIKFRVVGSTRKKLDLINFSFLYVRGSYHR